MVGSKLTPTVTLEVVLENTFCHRHTPDRREKVPRPETAVDKTNLTWSLDETVFGAAVQLPK